jgi:acetyl esterase/lipase
MYTHGAKYPDFLDDAKAAVDFVADYMKNIGNNGPLLVAGASAGAWLGLMLCLNPSYKPNAPIAGWLIESPQTTSHFNIIKYEMGLDPRMERINEYAPLYFVDPDTVFSKMLLIVYDNDLPCRYEENMLFIKHIKRFNTSVGGALTVTLQNGFRDYVSRRQLKSVKERLEL